MDSKGLHARSFFMEFRTDGKCILSKVEAPDFLSVNNGPYYAASSWAGLEELHSWLGTWRAQGRCSDLLIQPWFLLGRRAVAFPEGPHLFQAMNRTSLLTRDQGHPLAPPRDTIIFARVRWELGGSLPPDPVQSPLRALTRSDKRLLA